MKNNIPVETLLKGLELIQRAGVDEEIVFSVKKLFDSEVGEKIIQDYIKSGKVGDLDLSGNLNIQKLPKGLKVKGLNLTENKTIKHLPKIEAKTIWAGDTNIQTIEEGLKCELLSLWGNKTIKHLPKMEAEEILAVGTNIQTIGDGLKCGLLDLEGNQALKEFPRNFEVKRLDLRNTHFSQTHTEEKVREMIKDGGGKVGQILM